MILLPLFPFLKQNTEKNRSDLYLWKTPLPPEGKALPPARSPQEAGQPRRGRGPPFAQREGPHPQSLAGAHAEIRHHQPEPSKPALQQPPSLRPAPGPRSTYPQKANFQLPQSHGRAGCAFNERLRRSPERS